MTDWIFDTMVSMTLLMLLVLILRRPVAHFFGAHIAYLLWALPLARLFMPTLTLEAPAVAPASSSAAEFAGSNMLAAPALAAAPVTESAFFATMASLNWPMILMIIWLGGAGMMFISKLAAYFQFREDIVSDGQLIGKHGNIRILETAAVGGPLAFGLAQKYIAVPTNFFRDYAPRERQLALDHEIAHHESGDLAANFVGLLILSLHWFNPVAWFAWIAFRQDQEAACDARILQNSGRDVRAVYGRTIAKSVSGHKLGLASPLNQKNKIKSRLKMLGQSEKSSMRKRVGALMVGASTVVALPMTATITYAEANAHPHEDQTVSLQVDEDSAPLKIKSNSTTVDVGRNGVVTMEKTEAGYAYQVENDAGSFSFKSDRKLSDKEVAKRLKKMKRSREQIVTPIKAVSPLPPVAPVAPKAPDPSAKVKVKPFTNITILNGETDGTKIRSSGKEYVQKVKYDGRTVVLRTSHKLSKEEAYDAVADAEESRLEAEAEARELRKEKKRWQKEWREARLEADREAREAEREIEQERREAAREAREAIREAEKEAREALREARAVAREAEREARAEARKARAALREAEREAHEEQQELLKAQSVAMRIWEATQMAFKPDYRVAVASEKRSGKLRKTNWESVNCTAMNREIALGGQPGYMRDQAWAVVAGCKTVEVKTDRKELLRIALKGLKKSREEALKCERKDADHIRKLRDIDREIKEINIQLSMT